MSILNVGKLQLGQSATVPNFALQASSGSVSVLSGVTPTTAMMTITDSAIVFDTAVSRKVVTSSSSIIGDTVCRFAMDGNATTTVANNTPAGVFLSTLEIFYITGTMTWPSTISWPGGVTPDLQSGITRIDFITYDQGARWFAIVPPVAVDTLFAPPSPVLVSSGTTESAGTSATSISFTAPAGIQDGDVIVFAVQQHDDRAPTMAGWTFMSDDISDLRPMIIAAKTMTAAESSTTITMTFASPPTISKAMGSWVLVRSCALSNFVYVNDGASASDNTPSNITTTQSNALVLYFAGSAGTLNATTPAAPTGYTQRQYARNTTGNSTDIAAYSRVYATGALVDGNAIPWPSTGTNKHTYLVGVQQ